MLGQRALDGRVELLLGGGLGCGLGRGGDLGLVGRVQAFDVRGQGGDLLHLGVCHRRRRGRGGRGLGGGRRLRGGVGLGRGRGGFLGEGRARDQGGGGGEQQDFHRGVTPCGSGFPASASCTLRNNADWDGKICP
jgi:hypothetical protein